MDSGLVAGRGDAAPLTLVRDAAAWKLAQTIERCQAAIAAAEESVQRANAALATAEERLRRAQHVRMKSRQVQASGTPAATSAARPAANLQQAGAGSARMS
jgi:hypothetical protein